MPIENLEALLEQVNCDYEYKTEDVKKILESRKKSILRDNNQSFGKLLEILPPAGNSRATNLTAVLRQEMRAKTTNERILLIPCRIRPDYYEQTWRWVGVLIEFDSNNSITRAVYLDSQNFNSEEPPSILQDEFIQAYPNNRLVTIPCRHDEYVTASGPLMIENLFDEAAKQKILDQSARDRSLRAVHLSALSHDNPTFYHRFVQRQSLNLALDGSRDDFISDVNQKYAYASDEIRHILYARLDQITASNPQAFANQVILLEPVLLASNELYNRLAQESMRINQDRQILIPCQMNDTRWVGILLEIVNSKLVRAIYLDPTRSDVHARNEALNALERQLGRRQRFKLDVHPCMKHEDITQSGPLTIENLLSVAQKLSTSDSVLDGDAMQRIRASHLHALIDSASASEVEFFGTFYTRQRFNAPTVANPRGVDEFTKQLFGTLSSLGSSLQDLKKGIKRSRSVTSSKEFYKLFNLVLDRNKGELCLQIKDPTKCRQITPFLPVRTGFTGLLKDFALAEGTFLTGAALSHAAGTMTLSEAAVAMSAGTIDGVMTGVAGVVNLPAMVATVAATAAVAKVKNDARKSAHVLGRVLTQYQNILPTNQTVLAQIKAELEIEFQFLKIHQKNDSSKTNVLAQSAAYIKPQLTRMTDFISGASYQNDFARLLHAQIKTDLDNNGSEQFLKEAFNQIEDRILKGICLVSRIKHLRIRLQNVPVDPADKESLLRRLQRLINKLNLEYSEVVKEYFSALEQACEVIFNIIRDKEKWTQAPAKFSRSKYELDRIINFRDLDCLRYMEPYGKISEISFIFLQALCHVVYEMHYKSIRVPTAADTQAMKDAVSAAKQKLEVCQKLMRECNDSAENEASRPEFEEIIQRNIGELVNSYHDFYIEHHKIQDQMPSYGEAQLTLQFDSTRNPEVNVRSSGAPRQQAVEVVTQSLPPSARRAQSVKFDM